MRNKELIALLQEQDPEAEIMIRTSDGEYEYDPVDRNMGRRDRMHNYSGGVNMEEKIKQCPEFPFFGASYPDAICCDGYLWDLDSYDSEVGGLTIGGDVPCPFCKTEEFIEYDPFGLLYVGNDKEKTREWYFSYIEKLREDIDNKKYFNNEL